ESPPCEPFGAEILPIGSRYPEATAPTVRLRTGRVSTRCQERSQMRSKMTSTEAKIGAAGGILYGVISLVAWQLWACPSFPHLPHFPPMNSPAATWAAWYVHHQDVKRLAGSLWALSVLPMVF